MPDISMCLNNECPLKEKYYRFMADPSDWQSFSRFDPKNGKCENFIKLRK